MNMRFKTLLVLLSLAATTFPAPIRVGVFKGIGSGCSCWRTSIHTAGNVISDILANPLTSNLGPDLVLPLDTFLVGQYGTPSSATGPPTPDQKRTFIEALDSLDVVVFPNTAHYAGLFTDSTERAKIEAFAKIRGVVSIHMSIYRLGSPIWEQWDSLHGAIFQNYPSSDRTASIYLDTISQSEPSWKFLNRGLTDTAFLESWISFTTNGEAIRNVPKLKVTLRVDESSYAGGLGGARAMGTDHPLSWYRSFSEGGRFFYTAIGGRGNLYQGAAPSRFLRRQLYNAILWAAGVDSTGTVSIADRNRARHPRFGDHARMSFNANALTVSLLRDGPNKVEVLGVDGRRMAFRRGEGRTEHRFDALRSGAYIVVVTTGKQRVTRMAVVE
jgi:hypothetical protein